MQNKRNLKIHSISSGGDFMKYVTFLSRILNHYLSRLWAKITPRGKGKHDPPRLYFLKKLSYNFNSRKWRVV